MYVLSSTVINFKLTFLLFDLQPNSIKTTLKVTTELKNHV